MSRVTVWQRRWSPILVMVLAIGLSGCASEPVKEDRYQVRGVFLGQRFEGAAMRVRHEAIPGFMDAMSMDFKLADPSELANLSPGDKVAFVYVVTVDDSYAEGIEILPPETSLELEAVE
jgi:protein SCO1/2